MEFWRRFGFPSVSFALRLFGVLETLWSSGVLFVTNRNRDTTESTDTTEMTETIEITETTGDD